jgi:hypothetical protein
MPDEGPTAGVREKPAANRLSRLEHESTEGHEALERAELLTVRPRRSAPSKRVAARAGGTLRLGSGSHGWGC